MTLEEIRELKERAKQSITNNEKAFENHEVYTIICEWERAEEKLKKIEEYTKNIVDDETYKADWLYDVNGTQVRRDLEELLK